MFRVDPKTVTRWAKAGKLSAIRTLGGHRRYRESDVAAVRRVLAARERGVRLEQAVAEAHTLRRVGDSVYSLLRTRHPELTVDIEAPESGPVVTGDSDGLWRVVENLVENAARYGRDEGRSSKNGGRFKGLRHKEVLQRKVVLTSRVAGCAASGCLLLGGKYQEGVSLFGCVLLGRAVASRHGLPQHRLPARLPQHLRAGGGRAG